MSAKRKQQNQPSVRPFLKWAGGKFRLVDKILAALPDGKRLIEPFSGAAAVTLNSQYQRYWLNDINHDLIAMYKQLKTNHHEFIEYAELFFGVNIILKSTIINYAHNLIRPLIFLKSRHYSFI